MGGSYLSPRWESTQLGGSNMGPMVQSLVLHTFSHIQEVEAALSAAEHLLPL